MSAKEPGKSNSTKNLFLQDFSEEVCKNEYVSQFHQHLIFRSVLSQILKGVDSMESSNYY